MNPVNLNVNDLMVILGQKEVEIQVLRQQAAALAARLQELEPAPEEAEAPSE